MSGRKLVVKFRAMLHQTGQSRDRPYTVGVESGEILLADKQGNVLDTLDPSDWDLKVDNDDQHVILEDLSRGQRLICDIGLLDQLVQSVANPRFNARARRLKKEIKARMPADVSVTALLGVLILAFVAWLGFGYPMCVNAYRVQLANAPAIIRAAKSSQEEYVRSVSDTITRRWQPPLSEDDRSVILRFDVDRSGKATNVKISKGSGDLSFDERAKVCLRSAQFEPLPEEFGQSVPLEFTFSYKKPAF